MSVVILRGDAACLPLADESVDLICTSPPYFAQRAYADGGEVYDGQIGNEPTPAEYVAALVGCTREWARVLRPQGSIFVVIGDKYAGSGGTGNSGLLSPKYKGNTRAVPPTRGQRWGHAPKSLLGLPWRYAIACADELGLILREEVIWHKTNAQPESAADRTSRAHEQVLHFTRQPRYFAALDGVRQPLARPRKGGASAFGARNLSQPRTSTAAYEGPNPAGALPGSVWGIATVPLQVPPELDADHFASFPPELCRRIILGWSAPGGLVLDPFGGSGTTALVADVHGRTGISADLSMDYARIARWRTADRHERARALNVPRPPVVPDGQGSLFDDREVS